ncbi:hypothetical protein HID58_042219 [Brassica napus]|uniref:Gamma-tubulin complex component n=1 Tax=Brassica napus TaxID=3708 RepID=A0ABQ8BD26_BRANA|nr:hypothetical protein HID58_042219 [Brassica napus]
MHSVMRVYLGLRDKSLWELCGILEVINDEVLFYIWKGLLVSLKAMECYESSHHIDKTIFSTEDLELVGAVNHPSDWLVFRAQTRASLVVKIVSKEMISQLYVAVGALDWLKDLIKAKKPLP